MSPGSFVSQGRLDPEVQLLLQHLSEVSGPGGETQVTALVS
jgi:hypothetical protein